MIQVKKTQARSHLTEGQLDVTLHMEGNSLDWVKSLGDDSKWTMIGRSNMIKLVCDVLNQIDGDYGDIFSNYYRSLESKPQTFMIYHDCMGRAVVSIALVNGNRTGMGSSKNLLQFRKPGFIYLTSLGEALMRADRKDNDLFIMFERNGYKEVTDEGDVYKWRVYQK